MHLPEQKISQPCPELITLAAYLDGRLDQREVSHIESHILRCGRCLGMTHELIEGDAARDSNMVFVPQHVIGRAQSLMPALIGRPLPLTIWLRRGAAAAAVIAIGITGNAIGVTLSHAGSGAADVAELDREMSFGLIDSISQDSGELFAIAIGETDETIDASAAETIQ